MKDKRKLIVLLVAAAIVLAGIIHSVLRYVYFLNCRFMSAPAEIAFLWLVPYGLAAVICLIVGGVIVHKIKK